MPRRGHAYPVTADWQKSVRARLKELGWKPADLVRESGVSKASVSEMLNAGAVQTTAMPDIHRALGWPPPLLCPPLYVLQLVRYFEQLSDMERGQQLERLRQAAETSLKRH